MNELFGLIEGRLSTLTDENSDSIGEPFAGKIVGFRDSGTVTGLNSEYS